MNKFNAVRLEIRNIRVILTRMFSSPSILQSSTKSSSVSSSTQKSLCGVNSSDSSNDKENALTAATRDLSSKLVSASFDDGQKPASPVTIDHFIMKRVEGSPGHFNDVIVFPSNEPDLEAKCNFVFFGGDIQDYLEEMQKNPTSRHYAEWNLVVTGKLLAARVNAALNGSGASKSRANLMVVRADSFHLKCFAK